MSSVVSLWEQQRLFLTIPFGGDLDTPWVARGCCFLRYNQDLNEINLEWFISCTTVMSRNDLAFHNTNILLLFACNKKILCNLWSLAFFEKLVLLCIIIFCVCVWQRNRTHDLIIIGRICSLLGDTWGRKQAKLSFPWCSWAHHRPFVTWVDNGHPVWRHF